MDADGAHEAQRPTEAAIDKVAALLAVDTALLSDEEFALAEIGRMALSTGAEFEVEQADVSHLPDWAKNLPWARPSAAAEPLYHHEPAAGVHAYDTDEIAFHHLVRCGLGKPSTLVGHARRFAARELYRPDTGLTEKGRRWLDASPTILQAADTSLMMEAVFDESDAFEDERTAIEYALAMLGEAEQRYIDKRLRGEAVLSLLNGDSGDKKPRTTGPAHPDEAPAKRAEPPRQTDARKAPGRMQMGV